MEEHINFYENLKEANMRLTGTVVLYDGLPYYVFAITNHKPDEIFRVYLAPLGEDKRRWPDYGNYNQGDPAMGTYIDKWMVDNPKGTILRKQMNSPLFNKFRPYPLGMCNKEANVYYIERQPNRKTEQGVIPSMLCTTRISSDGGESIGRKGVGGIDYLSAAFRDCVLGLYPSAQEALIGLLDPSNANTAVAFHRNFALVRGPINMIFLAYKEDVVGVLPDSNLNKLQMGAEYKHVLEAVYELNLFTTVKA